MNFWDVASDNINEHQYILYVIFSHIMILFYICLKGELGFGVTVDT